MNDLSINPVILRYFLKDSQKWIEIVLDFTEFFDIEEEYFSVFDLIEKHFLEPRLYTKSEINNIVFLNIEASENIGNKKIKKFTFWNNGLCQLMDSMEYSKEFLKYRTIVTSICNIKDKNNNIVIRYDLLDDQLYPTMHVESRNEEFPASSINLDELDQIIKAFQENN